MHYVLVGPGALGCLLAEAAARGLQKNDRFTILDHNRQRADHIEKNGIVCSNSGVTTTVPVEATADPAALGWVDVAVVCVKSYDLTSCLAFCEPILGPKTLVILLQNGIAHLAFAQTAHAGATGFGTTTEGATNLGPGHVLHAGKGLTQLGFTGPVGDHFHTLLRGTQELLARGGLQTITTDAILTKLWAKLFINVGINALTATLQCKNGELLTIPGAGKRMERAVLEAVEVARAKNIPIDHDPVAATRLVCEKTGANTSSMLQDVRNKKATEIDAINGAVVAFAQEYGIATPENSLLLQQVREIERTYQ